MTQPAATFSPFCAQLSALADQRQSIETSLRAFIASEDHFDLGMDERGDFAALVAGLCRPALFSKERAAQALAPVWQQLQDRADSGLSDGSICLALPLDELRQAAEALEPAGALFQFRIQELRGFAPGAVGIVELGHEPAIFVNAGVQIVPPGVRIPALSASFAPRLTIPEVEVLFPDLWESSQTHNTWLWHRIELYEAWQEQVCPGRRRDDYIQVGGWASFVQDGDQGRYVAQVNNDIGDAGSVYLMCDEAGELQADVQMC